MNEIVYCPKHRILAVLQDGYVKVSYSGGIAEQKFMEALAPPSPPEGGDARVCIAGGDYRMKLMPAAPLPSPQRGETTTPFMFINTDEVVQRINIKRRDYTY